MHRIYPLRYNLGNLFTKKKMGVGKYVSISSRAFPVLAIKFARSLHCQFRVPLRSHQKCQKRKTLTNVKQKGIASNDLWT